MPCQQKDTNVQTTLKTRVTLAGAGLHSGRPARLTLAPAEAGSGIAFLRTDVVDGAHGLGKDRDRVMRRHVAGIEVDLSGEIIVAGDQAMEDLGEEAALLHAEASHDSEVDRNDAPLIVDEEVSLGDFVLTGGEVAAMVVIDSVVRLLPGALGDDVAGQPAYRNKRQ